MGVILAQDWKNSNFDFSHLVLYFKLGHNFCRLLRFIIATYLISFGLVKTDNRLDTITPDTQTHIQVDFDPLRVCTVFRYNALAKYQFQRYKLSIVLSPYFASKL